MTLSLSKIRILCLNQNSCIDNKVYRTLRPLGVGRGPPTRRGTRAGRLNRFWHSWLPDQLHLHRLRVGLYLVTLTASIPPSVPPAVPVLSISNEVKQQFHTSLLQVAIHDGAGTGRHQTESSSCAMDKLLKPSPFHHSPKTPNKSFSVCLLNS